MSRIMEEPKLRVHSDLMHELNEMSIRIKLHYLVSFEKYKELADAGKMPDEPTHNEIVELLDRALRELNQCTNPLKLR